MSHVTCEGKVSGSDPKLYRQHFAEKWKLYLRENFRSAGHVADVFQINCSTAEKWWEGMHQPQGWAVDWAKEVLSGGEP